MNLSRIQLEALEKIRQSGGRIERRSGGYWTAPGTPRVADAPASPPQWWFSTYMVETLAARGVLAVSKTEHKFGASLPIEYVVQRVAP